MPEMGKTPKKPVTPPVPDTVDNLDTRVITELDKASTKFTKTAGELSKVIETISAFTEEVNDITIDIQNKKAELKQLDLEKDLKEKQIDEDIERTKKSKIADLDLELKQDADKKVKELLSKDGLVSINEDELIGLRNEVENLKLDNKDEINKAVNAAVAAAKSKSDFELEKKLHEKDKETQKDKVALDSALKEIEFLKNALATAEKTIEDERAARITIAEKTSQPIINISK